MKIPLSITEDYCPAWKAWHGIRELVQNSIDADDDGYKMTVKHRGDKLSISNERVVLDTRVLLLGGTQNKSATARGRHREGMKIGILALLREGCAINIFSGDEVWHPEIEHSEQFANQRVLVINTRKLRVPREDFLVEVEGISKEVWDAIAKRFLFIKKPDPGRVIESNASTVLLEEQFKGTIFSRGIYVATVPDLAVGYDLADLELDRDRQVVNQWDLRLRLAALWETLVEKDPDRHAADVYRMAKNGSEEMQSMRHYGGASLAKVLRKELEKEHGEGVIPISSMQDAEAVEKIGGKAVIVDARFKELIEKDGQTAQAMQEAKQRSVTKRFLYSDLTPEEQCIFHTVVGKVAGNLPLQIVEYADITHLGKYDADGKTLQFSRAALALSFRELTRMVVAQVAIHRGKMVEEVYLDLMYPPMRA